MSHSLVVPVVVPRPKLATLHWSEASTITDDIKERQVQCDKRANLFVISAAHCAAPCWSRRWRASPHCRGRTGRRCPLCSRRSPRLRMSVVWLFTLIIPSKYSHMDKGGRGGIPFPCSKNPTPTFLKEYQYLSRTRTDFVQRPAASWSPRQNKSSGSHPEKNFYSWSHREAYWQTSGWGSHPEGNLWSRS